jgi:two-component system, NtrC family, nitrogen regulation sensor histidine kinase NtrY
MVEQLEQNANKLAQSERETAWKQMARQVTHEIKNPLTPMKLTIQQLQRMQSMDNEAFNEYFERSSVMLIEQIEHLSSIATAFSDFARMPEARHERVNIIARLERVIDLFKHNKESVIIEYTTSTDECFILADKEQLTQVFNNLIKNAIQAIPDNKKGLINIKAELVEHKVRIEIQDNGTGISAEIQDKLFTPNFTTKTSGMGLGLAIVKNIVDSNGGKIWFNTKLQEGTSFYLEFPIC